MNRGPPAYAAGASTMDQTLGLSTRCFGCRLIVSQSLNRDDPQPTDSSRNFTGEPTPRGDVEPSIFPSVRRINLEKQSVSSRQKIGNEPGRRRGSFVSVACLA